MTKKKEIFEEIKKTMDEINKGSEEQKEDKNGDKKDLQDQLKRLAADFDNFKKRTAKEQEALKDNTNAVMLSKLLPVIDEFGIAITQMEKAKDKEFKDGITMIYNKLIETMKTEGLEEMRVMGETFDPYKHDSVKVVEGKEDDKIVEVVQKGYLFKGKILRHAKVIVSKKK